MITRILQKKFQINAESNTMNFIDQNIGWSSDEDQNSNSSDYEHGDGSSDEDLQNNIEQVNKRIPIKAEAKRQLRLQIRRHLTLVSI